MPQLSRPSRLCLSARESHTSLTGAWDGRRVAGKPQLIGSPCSPGRQSLESAPPADPRCELIERESSDEREPALRSCWNVPDRPPPSSTQPLVSPDARRVGGDVTGRFLGQTRPALGGHLPPRGLAALSPRLFVQFCLRPPKRGPDDRPANACRLAASFPGRCSQERGMGSKAFRFGEQLAQRLVGAHRASDLAQSARWPTGSKSQRRL